MNVLKPNLRISIQTLLQAGKAQREIARMIGVDPKTVRRIARESKSPGVATWICAGKAGGKALESCKEIVVHLPPLSRGTATALSKP